ncbi:MAG: hypothetical protein ACTS7E_03300 [Arsenophonus sp. NC-CH8-MAG3]
MLLAKNEEIVAQEQLTKDVSKYLSTKDKKYSTKITREMESFYLFLVRNDQLLIKTTIPFHRYTYFPTNPKNKAVNLLRWNKHLI